MSRPTGHCRTQRPHPTHPAMQYLSDCSLNCASSLACTFQGWWAGFVPEACSGENRGICAVVPDAGSWTFTPRPSSSTRSIAVYVVLKKVQTPQLRHFPV
jgi:hypothetical protein